jgi:formylglycine-generating enzyme required for sulfatase activity
VAELKIKQIEKTDVAVVLPTKKNQLKRSYKPGDTFKDCENCPEMIVVPPGEYLMGSPKSDKAQYQDEGPQHKVKIAKKFAVGKFEITRAQFAAFVKETGHDVGNMCLTYEDGVAKNRTSRNYENPGFKQEDTHPAVCVNWTDAKAYVRWLNTKITGAPYKLLSEAEWEYVARAKSKTAYHFGQEMIDICSYGNGADQASLELMSWSNNECKDGYVFTSPVGVFAVNDFGVHDVHGNVREWVEDCWHDNYHEAPTDGKAWTREGNCSMRVLRGGSWFFNPDFLRSAERSKNYTSFREANYGFRVARSLGAQKR